MSASLHPFNSVHSSSSFPSFPFSSVDRVERVLISREWREWRRERRGEQENRPTGLNKCRIFDFPSSPFARESQRGATRKRGQSSPRSVCPPRGYPPGCLDGPPAASADLESLSGSSERPYGWSAEVPRFWPWMALQSPQIDAERTAETQPKARIINELGERARSATQRQRRQP